ncbi:MAG: 30S ribosome-binding factor RbfA [Bradymonadaceae bacterium]
MANQGNQGFDRTDRVSQKLHETLAKLVLNEIRDPRLQGLEITDVDISPDLKHAQVYWVLIQEADERKKREATEGLEKAKGYLKREVGGRLDTKYTPDLDFRYDESLERGRRIEELLDEADTGDES